MPNSSAFILFTAFMLFVNALASSPNWRAFSVSSAVPSSLIVVFSVPLLTPLRLPWDAETRLHQVLKMSTHQGFIWQRSHAILLTVPSIFLGLGRCCMLSCWFWWAVSEDSEVLPSAGPASSELSITYKCKNSADREHYFPIHPLPTIATLDVTWTKKCTHSGHSGNLHKFFFHFICSVIVQALAV